MAKKYMVQKMSSGTLKAVTYYRKQSAHPSHKESGAFTAAAKAAYAAKSKIAARDVETGAFRSSQGAPTGTGAVEI